MSVVALACQKHDIHVTVHVVPRAQCGYQHSLCLRNPSNTYVMITKPHSPQKMPSTLAYKEALSEGSILALCVHTYISITLWNVNSFWDTYEYIHLVTYGQDWRRHCLAMRSGRGYWGQYIAWTTWSTECERVKYWTKPMAGSRKQKPYHQPGPPSSSFCFINNPQVKKYWRAAEARLPVAYRNNFICFFKILSN